MILDEERQINRWKRIVSRFKGKLINMTKDVNGKLNDYSSSPKIRQVLFQWGYELTKRMCCNSFSLNFLSYFLLFKR